MSIRFLTRNGSIVEKDDYDNYLIIKGGYAGITAGNTIPVNREDNTYLHSEIVKHPLDIICQAEAAYIPQTLFNPFMIRWEITTLKMAKAVLSGKTVIQPKNTDTMYLPCLFSGVLLLEKDIIK